MMHDPYMGHPARFAHEIISPEKGETSSEDVSHREEDGAVKTCETSVSEKLVEVRQQVIETLLEIDDIKLQVNPQLLAQYARTIGYLEDDLFKWQLKARRCKRRFALAQAAANKREPIVLDEIDSTLDDEFAEWEAQLAERMASQLQLLEALSGSRPLSPSEERELKELHRKLIRRLHPDIHPDLSEDAQRFFLIAQAAYENGDVDTLRVVDTATEDYEEHADTAGLSEDNVAIELAMAEAQLNVAREQLDVLKHSHPYTLAELLSDPVELAHRTKEFKMEIERQKEVVRTYESGIVSLMEGEAR